MGFKDELDRRKTKALIEKLLSEPEGRIAMSDNLHREASALLEQAYSTLGEETLQVESDIPQFSPFLKKEVEKGAAEMLKIKTDQNKRMTPGEQRRVKEASSKIYNVLEYLTLYNLGAMVDRAAKKDIKWNKNTDKALKHMGW